MANESDELLTIREAAEELRISISKMYQLMQPPDQKKRSGQTAYLPYVKIDGARRIRRSTLRQFMEKHEQNVQ